MPNQSARTSKGAYRDEPTAASTAKAPHRPITHRAKPAQPATAAARSPVEAPATRRPRSQNSPWKPAPHKATTTSPWSTATICPWEFSPSSPAPRTTPI
ncbi:hypothetical protein GJ744_005224 [Endocarpon pusillum]|uniref:Uncharacterized protein n=1 Tax=Endocarpon pusillum TaxID=364733 RepID=A0A8H7A8U2_9EURO|nr:hypothetical protein GJ744_005224 [Endocarpon pusillum]